MPLQHRTMARNLHLAFNVGPVSGLTDSELLERFINRRDSIGEAAFSALVQRHRPVVFHVCRSVLRDHHSAEDATQATFLILARKANSLAVPKSLAPWLHGVATRVSANLKAAIRRRRASESKIPGTTFVMPYDRIHDDEVQILHGEINRMPECYRAPLVLCDLQGLTYDEASRVLGRPMGTIKSQLTRAREQLRRRMVRRGIAPAVMPLIAAASARRELSTLSAAAIDALTRIATQFASGHTTTLSVSPTVLALTEGATKTMLLSTFKMVAVALFVGCGLFSISITSGQLALSEPSHEFALSAPPLTDNKKTSSSAGPVHSDFQSASPWETVVRVRILGTNSVGCGSGTTIDSTKDESLILTSAHQFKIELVEPERKIKVDRFDERVLSPTKKQAHFVETVDAELVDCDFAKDICLLRIRPGRRLRYAKIVPKSWEPRSRMKMLSMGCSEGADPTSWWTFITQPLLQDSLNHEYIECIKAPKPGRSGGGLFTDDGYLAGICNYAEPRGDHGWYATPKSIHGFLDRNNLTFLYAAGPIDENEMNDLVRLAQTQLEAGDLAGVESTIKRLTVAIDERRRGLQESLRALETTHASQRDNLIRRMVDAKKAQETGNLNPK